MTDPSAATDSATYRCGRCGNVASTVRLVSPGQPDPGLTPEPPGAPPGISMMFADDGTSSLSIDGGPVSITLGPVEPGRVAAALATGDAADLFAIDSEYAPFWCPKCTASYCADHFLATAMYDEGFFDYIKGVCPEGHERILED